MDDTRVKEILEEVKNSIMFRTQAEVEVLIKKYDILDSIRMYKEPDDFRDRLSCVFKQGDEIARYVVDVFYDGIGEWEYMKIK